MQKPYLVNLAFLIATIGLGFLAIGVEAQTVVVPDATLGKESAVVQSLNSNNSIVSGGALRGNTLFQSLTSLHIGANGSVTFLNPQTTQNIITRITGKTISNIDGSLIVPGTANIFISNPNGFVFGSGARLITNGSFFATTANSIQFANGFIFDRINIPPANLTIGNKLLLNFNNSGSITINNVGHNVQEVLVFEPFVQNTNVGLSTSNNQAIGFVANGIDLMGGIIQNNYGSLLLGSVSKGQVLLMNLGDHWKASYLADNVFSDIKLDNKSLLASQSGYIDLHDNNLTVQNGSFILAESGANESGGSININSVGSSNFDGVATDGSFRSGIGAEATKYSRSATINIITTNLNVTGGAVIGNKNFDFSSGEPINIIASGSTQLLDYSPLKPLQFSGISSLAIGFGNGSDINLTTGSFFARNGGDLGSSTFAYGDSGNVSLNTNSATLIGFSPLSGAPSTITAASFGSGSAGNLAINTQTLLLAGGAQIGSTGLASGNAGNVTVNATKSIQLIGSGLSQFPTSIESGVQINPTLDALFNLPPTPSGKAANISLTTQELSLQNGARITVRNDGQNDAGNINIKANFLENSGSTISASTNGGNGGNLEFKVNQIILINGIFTTNARKNGNGGSISIQSNILAINNQSLVQANAFLGRGGRVNISTSGLISNNLEAITATSQGGPKLNGKVVINVANALIRQPMQSLSNSTALVSPRICDANNKEAVRVLLGSDTGQASAIIEKLSTLPEIPHARTSDGHRISLITEQGFILDSNKIYRPIVAIPKSAFSPESIQSICASISQNAKKL